MGRCFGIARNLHRCGRIGDWKFFCFEHRLQPILGLFFLLFTIPVGLASIKSTWISPSESKPIKHARVLFANKKLIFPTNEGDPVRITFGLINVGDADATVTLKDQTYYFSIDPTQTIFKFQSFPADEILVSAIPNAIWQAEMRFNFQMTPEKLKALKIGKARLFFYARGEYRDATGETYVLPFAEMYDPTFPGNLISPPKDIIFE